MDSQKNNSHLLDSKLAAYWERFAIYVACSLIALCSWLYVKQEEKISQLDFKVQQLQLDKVSKQELKEMEQRISTSMEILKGDIIFHINLLRDKR